MISELVNKRDKLKPDQITVLQSIKVLPISFIIARDIIQRHHYLHSIPGGTMLTFGAFLNSRLLGAVVFGAGPFNGYRLVAGARTEDCLTLTRLWLSDELPCNSESLSLGIVLRALKQNTQIKFIVAYADPAQRHSGIIYQASNWVYLGLSSATPLYDTGDGRPRHSRSFAHEMGSHSLRYWRDKGITVDTVEQSAKHRYVFFLDPSWRERLTVPALKYPKKQNDIDRDTMPMANNGDIYNEIP